jgi:hypothetical protein
MWFIYRSGGWRGRVAGPVNQELLNTRSTSHVAQATELLGGSLILMASLDLLQRSD